MIIGLSGPAGSGKDTVAKIICDSFDYERLAFADPVREAVLAIDPIVELEESYGDILERRVSYYIKTMGWDAAKREFSEIRRLLQVVGTEVGRQIMGEDVWINIARSKMCSDKNYVITDMRFQNEANFVKSQGGIIIGITRMNNPYKIKSSHASERAQFDVDYSIGNHSSLEDLYSSVTLGLSEWLGINGRFSQPD